MRKRLPLLTAVLCLCISLLSNTLFAAVPVEDSVKILHTTDGDITEWKKDKFETDKETEILFAVDHDANNLYLALKVPSQQTQMKLMRGGMSLFIDKKGKRREGTGVQFPFKNDSNPFEGGNFDPKAVREKLMPGMIFLRTFGFDDEDKTQLITQQNGVNIAFDWDESDVMYIEYQVPMSLLGKPADLNGKAIAVGWKINGAEGTGRQPTIVRTELVAVPAGTRPGGNSAGRTGSGRSASMDMGSANAPRDLSFWTKYSLIF